jgi:hypothetical protein
VRMIVRELRENGGQMIHVGKQEWKQARRISRLSCKYGWNAEKNLDPFLEDRREASGPFGAKSTLT